jgi:murein DD-endopeptidase MepM/ murein hydrolase activator NlpD
LVALILLVAWGLREFYLIAGQEQAKNAALAAAQPTPTFIDLPVALPEFSLENLTLDGIPRFAYLHTDVPSRPRQEVVRYIVKPGDTLFGIAGKFGIQPETILWSNQAVLGDNPHSLRPDQELNILPVDGAYYRWSAGDGLNGVAKFFGVTPEDIINFSGNKLDPTRLGDWSAPNIEPGAWLVIPGGHREFVSWSAPVIPLDNPGVAKVLGPGACENVLGGAVGTGVFVWPSVTHTLSGFDYEPQANHPGIDISGKEGDAVYATDSGVIVYAGWNNWGYGNVIVINHANGWQTLYAHLSAYYVNCGQFVYQGDTIGAVGSTGNSTGSHLHFEMMYNGVRVNPHDYVR